MLEYSIKRKMLITITLAFLFLLGIESLNVKFLSHSKYVSRLLAAKTPEPLSSSGFQLKGFEKFVRNNPLTDKFNSKTFHHVEFYTGESIAISSRFVASLGLNLVAKSDFSTGNEIHASYIAQSGSIRMAFTAPYSYTWSRPSLMLDHYQAWQPTFDGITASSFITKHGLGVRAVAIEVDNVGDSFETMVQNGAVRVLPPTRIHDKSGRGFADIAEVSLYGDTVLRLVNLEHFSGAFLPNYEDIQSSTKDLGNGRFGFQRFDHIVGNVWKLASVVDYIQKMTGFHEFAEFVSDDVGTVDSGLNSVVMANNNEYILLPINEPTFGTKRKSQIQTYLEQYQGEGVQHMALLTNDIFATLKQMQDSSLTGIGFSFMAPPSNSYYERLVDRLGDVAPLTDEQLALAKKFGVLIDRDDQGMLLQIFTKPIGDRPTVFLEVIQRLGCQDSPTAEQKPGCGGFGKGNFKDLFKSIEEYENTLGINNIDHK